MSAPRPPLYQLRERMRMAGDAQQVFRPRWVVLVLPLLMLAELIFHLRRADADQGKRVQPCRRREGAPRRSVIAAVLIAAALGSGCHKREAPEVALKRAQAEFRRGQIASLEKLIAQAEKGELVTSDLIAIGISEELVKTLLGASLPREAVVADRLRVRVESAEPVFRGNKAGLLFRARVSSVDAPDASATIEMAGTLEDFTLDDGKLAARVRLAHFSVLESSIGDLAADALEGLVRANAGAIQRAIPPVEIPVQLEQAVKVGGLTEGAVVAKPGTLPLDISVRQVIPVNKRLWVLLRAKAGPWQPASALPAKLAEGAK